MALSFPHYYISPIILEKPLIAICPDQEYKDEFSLRFPIAAQQYVISLENNGASVILLKGYDFDIDALIKTIDGWLIPGGLDISPDKYGQQKDTNTNSLPLHNDRFEFEKKMINSIPKKMPILGICYGLQVLNVLSEGNLQQHISDHTEGCLRKMKVLTGSNLHKILGSEHLEANCYHHQVIDKLGNGYQPVVYDKDGSIHGIELIDKDRWIVGVQWHPERSQSVGNDTIINCFVKETFSFMSCKKIVKIFKERIRGKRNIEEITF